MNTRDDFRKWFKEAIIKIDNRVGRKVLANKEEELYIEFEKVISDIEYKTGLSSQMKLNLGGINGVDD